MRRSVQLGLAVVICAAALVGVPTSERAYGSRTATIVRIGADRTVARVYRPVVLRGRLMTASGRALGGRSVLLESRQATGAVWSPVARVKTNADGRVARKVRPQKTTYYRYRYAGSSRYRPDSSPAKKIAGHHYVLTFSEPFRGSRVNTATWTPKMQWGNHTRDHLQVYSPAALRVDDGRLVITATRRRATAADRSPYQSGVVSAHGQGQYNYRYGYLETRVKIPRGMGLWPAVWLLPTDPAGTAEMDVIEARGQEPRRNHMTLHYDHMMVRSMYDGHDMSRGFHTFGLMWTKDYVAWYWDGIERFRVTDRRKVPHVLMYPVANLQIGSWGGTPNSSTVFPARFYVDYIRVYQHE